VLSFGSIFAQFLGILAAPILTRLFAPEEFGIAGLFVSITGIIGVFSCLRYELAIMLPSNDDRAANLLAGGLISSIFISILSVFLVFFAKDSILQFFNVEQLGNYIWFVPPMVLMLGVFHIANYWNSRIKQFKQLSFVRIINSLSTNTFKLAMGFYGYVTSGVLIGATIVGQLIANLLLWTKIWNAEKRLFLDHIKFKEIVSALKQYKQFPKYVIWSGLLVEFSLRLPVFFIAYFYSSKELGFFVLVQSLLKSPFNIFGQAISQVFFQKAASIKKDIKKLSIVVESIFYFLITLSMFPALLLCILGNDFFSLFLGPNWSEAGIYAQIFSFSILVEFSSAPIGSLFNVLNKQREALFFNILLMLIRTISLISGCLTGNIYITILFFVIGDIIGRSLKFYYIFNVAGFKTKKILSALAKIFMFALPFFICALIAKYIFAFHTLIILLLSIVLTILNYFLNVYKTERFKLALLANFQTN